ncbi:four helix bundle protein [bacterium]|nr:four helix bundle protein [bacterium]
MKMRYENLEVTELIFQYIDFVYELAGRFPKDEMFGLGSQLKRAVNSVLMNVAEGSAKKSWAGFR